MPQKLEGLQHRLLEQKLELLTHSKYVLLQGLFGSIDLIRTYHNLSIVGFGTLIGIINYYIYNLYYIYIQLIDNYSQP